MKSWQQHLSYDPINPLLSCGDEAIVAATRRHLLGQTIDRARLWALPHTQQILRRQNTDGSWTYPAIKEHIRSQENYNQIETYRNLGILVEEYGFTAQHPAIAKAARYFFSCQSARGDFRGIYGNQYSPNYTAGIAELLIKAGYGDNAHIRRVFTWLLSIRQQDGGWAIPIRTRGYNLDVISMNTSTLEPDKTKPGSFMVTGVVLRAFAAHHKYKSSPEAEQAGKLLLDGLFHKDRYPDRAAAEYWTKFSFPFWFTDLISAMDSLSEIGFSKDEPAMQAGLTWFAQGQQKNGLWNLKILKGKSRDLLEYWLALGICRIYKRLYHS